MTGANEKRGAQEDSLAEQTETLDQGPREGRALPSAVSRDQEFSKAESGDQLWPGAGSKALCYRRPGPSRGPRVV